MFCYCMMGVPGLPVFLVYTIKLQHNIYCSQSQTCKALSFKMLGIAHFPIHLCTPTLSLVKLTEQNCLNVSFVVKLHKQPIFVPSNYSSNSFLQQRLYAQNSMMYEPSLKRASSSCQNWILLYLLVKNNLSALVSEGSLKRNLRED